MSIPCTNGHAKYYISSNFNVQCRIDMCLLVSVNSMLGDLTLDPLTQSVQAT
jgi:hypothetical protein